MTKEVNISEVKTSYEYVTELHERLEDSLKLAQEELQKTQKSYKKHHDKKAKPRYLEVGDQVLIFLLTDRIKFNNAVERTIHQGESCVSQQLQNKDAVQDNDVPHEYVEEVYY